MQNWGCHPGTMYRIWASGLEYDTEERVCSWPGNIVVFSLGPRAPYNSNLGFKSIFLISVFKSYFFLLNYENQGTLINL